MIHWMGAFLNLGLEFVPEGGGIFSDDVRVMYPYREMEIGIVCCWLEQTLKEREECGYNTLSGYLP